MSALRQRLAQDIGSGRLTHSPLEETAADRIGALGRSDPLGAALWRVLGDHDSRAARDAVDLMAHKLRKQRLPGRQMTLRLCWVVLQEWLANKCRKCGGRGLIYSIEGVADACTACGGTARRRHSDSERSRGMGWGKETYAKWEPLFAKAHDVLSSADTWVGRGVAFQLERGLR